MFSLLFASMAFGSPTKANSSLTLSDITASPGDTAIVSVEMTNLDPVAGWQFELHYQPSSITLGCHPDGAESEVGDCTNGIDDNANGAIDCSDMGCSLVQGLYGTELSISSVSNTAPSANGSHHLMALAFSLSGAAISPGSGELFSLAIEIDPNAVAGTYELSLENVILSTPNAQPLPVELFGGVVEIVAESVDADGDGFFEDEDCNDQDPDISPAAIEVCDEQDNDCDEDIDEGVTTDFYLDADGDGFGDANQPVSACEAPEGYVSDSSDCDDMTSAVNPDMDEVAGNDVDEDCDGVATPADSEPADEPASEPSQPSSEPAEPSTDNLDGDDDNSKAGACSQVGASDAGLWLLGLGLVFFRRRRLFSLEMK